MTTDPTDKNQPINAWPVQQTENRPVQNPENRPEKRPSDWLVEHHLNRSLRTHHLGIDRRRNLIHGSIDLYRRLKPRDRIDSIYINSIVALYNGNMDAFGSAAESGKLQEELLSRGIDGTRTLIDLIQAFEARRAVRLRDDPDDRWTLLKSVLDRIEA